LETNDVRVHNQS